MLFIRELKNGFLFFTSLDNTLVFIQSPLPTKPPENSTSNTTISSMSLLFRGSVYGVQFHDFFLPDQHQTAVIKVTCLPALACLLRSALHDPLYLISFSQSNQELLQVISPITNSFASFLHRTKAIGKSIILQRQPLQLLPISCYASQDDLRRVKRNQIACSSLLSNRRGNHRLHCQ